MNIHAKLAGKGPKASWIPKSIKPYKGMFSDAGSTVGQVGHGGFKVIGKHPFYSAGGGIAVGGGAFLIDHRHNSSGSQNYNDGSGY